MPKNIIILLSSSFQFRQDRFPFDDQYTNLTYFSSKMNEGDQAEEQRDTIQHYLRNLRKKVDHQLKNPFDFAFTNYSFAELATWKNNVLQLDATSRLYGQRVDFLHNGTMQILGSVLNSQPQKASEQEKHDVKKEQIYDNAPYERNLEPPQKINSEIVRVESNILLWREVCKKRDAISQLMLNELSTDQSLRLVFFPEEISANYQRVLNNESSVYMRLLDFKALSLNLLKIYKEIQEAVSESNMFMVSFNGKQRARGENIRIEQSFQLDFSGLDFGQPFIDRSFYVEETDVKQEERESLNQEMHIQELEVIEQNEDSESYENQSDFFSMQNWDKNDNQTKRVKRKKTKRKQQGPALEKKEEMINFIGINPFRDEVFLIETDTEEEKFLLPPDYLHVKFVKYPNPYAKKPKKMPLASKRFKTVEFASTLVQETTFFEQSSFPLCSDQNESFTNPMTSFLKQSRQKFKEAALPIKEMKRMIKKRVHELSLPTPKRLTFQQVKDSFRNEQPLDIFISLLHVAAEEEILLSI